MKPICFATIVLILILGILFAVNYFTVFGYYLPHRSQVIFMNPRDIPAQSFPQFIVVDNNILSGMVTK